MNITYTEIRCKYCGSANVIKYGTFNGIQRYWCKSCKRKFADNEALPGMQTPTKQVSSALNMYYEGMSLNAIRRQLELDHKHYPSDSTVYEWIDRFSNEAIQEAKKHHPKVGDVWIADETVLDIGGQNMWFWDIIDSDTRFLLASHISRTRTTRDAQILMEKAYERAGKIPMVVMTDKLAAYLDGIELTFGADTKHKHGAPFNIENNTNLIERFHGTLKERTKVMRGLKSLDTSQLITDGWLVHYNYFRPHEGLDNKTPAEVAGVQFPYKNWADVTNKSMPTIQTNIPTQRIAIPRMIQPTGMRNVTYYPYFHRPRRRRSGLRRQRINPTSISTIRF